MSTVWSVIEQRAAATPDREMLVDEHGRSMTFEQFRAAG